jgi:hypothetical protein
MGRARAAHRGRQGARVTRTAQKHAGEGGGGAGRFWAHEMQSLKRAGAAVCWAGLGCTGCKQRRVLAAACSGGDGACAGRLFLGGAGRRAGLGRGVHRGDAGR